MNDFTFAHRQEGFDQHIDQSIRHYSTLHNDIVEMSRYFVESNTNVYDLGCSTGKTLDAIHTLNKEQVSDVNYIGIDYASGFVSAMEERMKKNPFLDLKHCDVRDIEFSNASMITSIFTLQFMPRADRQDVLNNVYDGLNEGGTFIFAEKTYATHPKIQDILTFMYYDFKRKSFSSDDILTKEKTLRSMLRPNTMEELVFMLETAGFEHIQTFWQNHLFRGIICIK